MKKLFYSLVMVIIAIHCQSQTLTDTTVQYKNVLIEEFTGVECSSCPIGHQEIANLLSSYPDRVFAASMHSKTLGHTTPYGNDEDLTRPFPDYLFKGTTDLTGIPAGILNRRYYSGKQAFIFWTYPQFHDTIEKNINTVLNETSPFNIGVEAIYDSITKAIKVNTEVYTTANVNGNYSINVYFTESNIYTQQLDGNTVLSNYNQKHVFREILTPDAGTSIISSSANKGALFTNTFNFTNSKNYKMQNVEVIAFVTYLPPSSSKLPEVVTVNACHVTDINAIGIQKYDNTSDAISIYPVPANNSIQVQLNAIYPNTVIIISDVQGRTIFKKSISETLTTIDVTNLEKGVYFLSTNTQPELSKKLIIY